MAIFQEEMIQSYGAIIYAFWRERNNIIFAKGSQTKERIIENVKRIMQEKNAKLSKIGLTTSNVLIVMR